MCDFESASAALKRASLSSSDISLRLSRLDRLFSAREADVGRACKASASKRLPAVNCKVTYSSRFE